MVKQNQKYIYIETSQHSVFVWQILSSLFSIKNIQNTYILKQVQLRIVPRGEKQL